MPRPNWFFGFPLNGSFVEMLPEPPSSIRRYQNVVCGKGLPGLAK